MKSKPAVLFFLGIAGLTAVLAETSAHRRTNARLPETSRTPPPGITADSAVAEAVNWLVSVQGHDGGWGQDGGETSYVRQGERLESSGNDIANTAVALTALLRAGHGPGAGPHRDAFERGLAFILARVEQSPPAGLAITSVTGTQIQRKLGPYIDTFLTSKLLGELDGAMGNSQANARVRQAFQKCVAKIENNQLQDGSWNISGGWAPILGTSLASQSLYAAKEKGLPVRQMALSRVDEYTKRTAASAGGLMADRSGRVGTTTETAAVAAGVPLYKSAQELEQLSRTREDRTKNARQIAAVTSRLNDGQFVSGFGSIGGEEFFSYLNISDSLRRVGGPEWQKWNKEITTKILAMQNQDGTWAGHHCITGRVAVTGAAIVLLRSDREPGIQTSSLKK